MIYICDAQGNAVGCVPEHVVQGSAEACVLTVAAPVSESAQFSVSYRLPSGEGTQRQLLTCIGLMEGIQGEGGIPLYGWRGTIPAAVTAHYGTVAAQFFFTAADGSEQAGAPVLFTVERGVAGELPQQPTEDVYGQILAAIAQLRADAASADFAARALYAYREGAVYAAGEIVYCPEAAVYGTFVRSLVSDNSLPPYTESGDLNAEVWEEVCKFQDVYEQASAAQESASKAKISEDAAAVWEERASLFSRQAETQANIASEYASFASTYESSAHDFAEDAEQSAEEAKKLVGNALSFNYEYDSFESLPVPGSARFIYMIPSGSGEPGNEYAEYAWSEQKNSYERIGSGSGEDLSGFATKEYANSVVCTSMPAGISVSPAVGGSLSLESTSFSRLPQSGDFFSVLCKHQKTGELYFVCAKAVSVSGTAVQAQILSFFRMDETEVTEIVLTEEEIVQYEACNYRDGAIVLSAAVDHSKKFALLNLGGDGRIVMTGAQEGYMAHFFVDRNAFVHLVVKEQTLYVCFLFGLVSPVSSDAGKIPVVNGEGNGYELVSSVAKADSSVNAEHADTADTATTAQNAANAEQLGGVAASGYAKTTGTYSGMTVGNATDAVRLGGKGSEEYALKSEIFGGENFLINPDFKINQRGKTNYSNNDYGVDRWKSNGVSYAAKDSGTVEITSLGAWSYLCQIIEDYASFRGKTVTLSVKFKNFSYATGVPSIAIRDGVNTPTVSVLDDGIATLTTKISDNATQLYVYALYNNSNTISDVDTIIEWTKLEIGGAATGFIPPDSAVELLKCQRFFQKVTLHGCATASSGTTTVYAAVPLPTTMRAKPTITVNKMPDLRGNGVSKTPSSIGFQGLYNNFLQINVQTTGLTGNHVYSLSNGELFADAEL